MTARAWILLVPALLGALVAWWALGERRHDGGVTRGREAVLGPELAAEPGRDAPTVTDVADAQQRELLAAEAALAAAVTHRLVGRVVDQTRRPVSGATVGLWALGLEVPTVNSDADGHFALDVALDGVTLTERTHVWARDGSGQRGSLPAWFGTESGTEVIEVELGAITLVPTYTLRVRIVDGEAPVERATVRVELGHQRDFFVERTTDTHGELALDELEAGPVHLTARAHGRSGRTKTFVPEASQVLIELEPLVDAIVLVVDAANGAGIADAELVVHESYFVPRIVGRQDLDWMGLEHIGNLVGSERRFRTDDDGRARVDGLAARVSLDLGVRAHGYAPLRTHNSIGPRWKPAPDVLRLELTPQPLRTVRWPVVAGELPAPGDGTPLALRFASRAPSYGEERGLPGPARVEGAEVVVERVAGAVSLHAETPDGAIASLWIRVDEVLGKEISFRRARHIDVLVRDPRGVPIAAARASALDQSHDELCTAVETDAHGRARLERLHGALAEVHVAAPGEPLPGRAVGTVDLKAGDGSIETTLAPIVASRARLRTWIEGELGLPARFRVFPTSARVVEELPDRGELVLEISGVGPGEEQAISMHAAGFVVGLAVLAFPAGGGEAFAELALERSALLVAHVTGRTEGSVELLPQRFDPEAGRWGTAPELGASAGLHWSNGPDGSFVFEGISPGRWRVLDRLSKAASDEAELAPGAREAHVTLILAGIEWVTGRVVVDDPAELARVRVVLLEDGALPSARVGLPGTAPPEGVHMEGDLFRTRVPGDREVELVAWHPWLAAEVGVGRLRVRGGREGVVLRLTAGHELRMPTPGLVAALHAGARLARLARYASEPRGAPLEWHPVASVDGVLRCGLPRGTWSLWLDLGSPFAPLVLHDVEIAGPTELPAPELLRGSAIHLKLLVAEGQTSPRVHLYATRADEPSYDRQLDSDGSTSITLAGLGPGRFQIKATTMTTNSRGLERDVELDGVNDLELEFDLR